MQSRGFCDTLFIPIREESSESPKTDFNSITASAPGLCQRRSNKAARVMGLQTKGST